MPSLEALALVHMMENGVPFEKAFESPPLKILTEQGRPFFKGFVRSDRDSFILSMR